MHGSAIIDSAYKRNLKTVWNSYSCWWGTFSAWITIWITGFKFSYRFFFIPNYLQESWVLALRNRLKNMRKTENCSEEMAAKKTAVLSQEAYRGNWRIKQDAVLLFRKSYSNCFRDLVLESQNQRFLFWKRHMKTFIMKWNFHELVTKVTYINIIYPADCWFLLLSTVSVSK